MAEHELAKAIPLAKIQTSKSNPRKRFDEESLRELELSIRDHGVLQPILVRPLPLVGGQADLGTYELVAGERRYRAAMAAGLKEIPAVVRPLGDRQAAELQVIENLQREDLTDLEEARGFRQLVDLGVAAEEIAGRVGKSRAYVYARLKLLETSAGVRKALEDGEISASVALLLARLPVKVANKVLPIALGKESPPGEYSYGTMEAPSFRKMRDVVERHFARKLSSATWKLDDADFPEGSCVDCPRRTGKDADLFEDLSPRNVDVCTDVPCFEKKRGIALERKAAAALAGSKLRPVPAKDQAKVFPHQGSASPGGGYVDADTTCWSAEPVKGKQPTWREACQLDEEDLLAAVDPTGRVRAVIRAADAKKLAAERGKPITDGNAKYEEQRKKQLERLKIRRKVAYDLLPVLLEKVSAAALTAAPEVWRLIAQDAWENAYSVKSQIAKAHGWTGTPPWKKLSSDECLALCLECILRKNPAGYEHDRSYSPAFSAAAEAFGIDLQARHRAAAAEQRKKKAAPKKKSSTKAPAKRADAGAARPKKAAPKKKSSTSSKGRRTS